MGSRCDRGRSRLAAGALVLAVALSGCAPTAPSPALTSAADDARSATQTALLGVRQDEKSLLFPTTAAVVSQDMGEELTDAASTLALETTNTPLDAHYRDRALEATRLAISGVHAAEQGHPELAATRLRRAVILFDALGAE